MKRLIPVAFLLSRAASAADALPMNFGKAESLRDAPIEARCDLFVEFVREFAKRHLSPETGVRVVACGEGNGLGGAQYSVDFKVKGEASYRLDVGYPDNRLANVKLCDATASPIACSLNKPNEALEFEVKPERFATKAAAQKATASFEGIHANAKHLLPTVASWASAKPKLRTIYSQDYGAFLADMVAWKDGYPMAKGDDGAAKTLKMRLRPESDGNRASGALSFDEEPDQLLLECLQCQDKNCLSSLSYRFEDRFFWITRKDAKSSKPSPSGAGWIITSPKPFSDKGRKWKFLCGVSRYSLQNAVD